jgi:hypothetical protein
VFNFYSKLYSEQETEEWDLTNIIEDIPVLNNDESMKLEGFINLEEASFALKFTDNNNKKPW